MKTKFTALKMIVLSLIVLGCDGFLDEKPSKRIIVPSTIGDMYSILANTRIMNNDINLGVILSDDMITNDQGYLSFLNDFTRNAYKWENELFEPDGSNVFWNIPYGIIFHSNLILEKVGTIRPRNESEEFDILNLRGIALFHRANAYASLLQFFTYPIIETNDLQRPGIPLKLNSDVNDLQGRSKIGEVYDQIFNDLQEAKELLPSVQPSRIYPNKYAAYGLEARLQLILGNFEKALELSEVVLSNNRDLLNFEELSKGFTLPITTMQFTIPVLNKEILYYGNGGSSQAFTSPLSFVANELVEQYADGDLRKSLYFSSPLNVINKNFIGHFTGNFELFTGVAMDELYLINSECHARLGNTQKALEVLDKLLKSRFRNDKFMTSISNSPSQALELILKERRKTLVFRGYLRWSDLRRFLKEEFWVQPLPRVVEGRVYQLDRNPERYLLKFPLNEMDLNPAL